MASKICDGLLLGSQGDAETITPAEVSHILTVSCDDLPESVKCNFNQMWINVEDSVGQDLLSKFEEGIKFIEEGCKQKGCLVHCIVGVSRSTTMVAAYLMWKENLSLDLALEIICKQRPQASPNSGFMYQLSLFANMGCKVDNSNPEYKNYRLTSFANTLRHSDSLNTIQKTDLSSDPHLKTDDQDIVYKCKKCRRNLFRQKSIMDHTVGVGEAAFDWRAATEISHSEEACTKSLFIEPIQWMLEVIKVLDGKITCPKCQSKLGSFNWAGERCPCGRWITPAFHIGSGKVDKAVPRLTMPHPIL